MDLCGAAGNCHSGEIEESKIFHFFHLSIMNLILSMSASIIYQGGKLEFPESFWYFVLYYFIQTFKPGLNCVC